MFPLAATCVATIATRTRWELWRPAGFHDVEKRNLRHQWTCGSVDDRRSKACHAGDAERDARITAVNAVALEVLARAGINGELMEPANYGAWIIDARHDWRDNEPVAVTDAADQTPATSVA
jgi:hypothetical protein